MTIALVINAYNQPEYLKRVLKAVARQNRLPEEVLLADDGSSDDVRELFQNWSARQSCRCAHLWQKNEGFRRARILNLAIAEARSEYLVFLDGDTLPHPYFIADHHAVARPKFFVQGHRALVKRKAAAWFGSNDFYADRRRAILLNQISSLKNIFRWPFPVCRPQANLRGIRGCNLAIWRNDLVLVNGYNEAFTGWGREDSELATRLMNAGVQRLDLRGRAICFHLWHPPASRSGLAANEKLLEIARSQNVNWCELGLSGHFSASSSANIKR